MLQQVHTASPALAPMTTKLPCRHDLEFRRNCLEAESIQHLCKSIVMENTKLTEPVPGVSKYYCVIVQVYCTYSILALALILSLCHSVLYHPAVDCVHAASRRRLAAYQSYISASSEDLARACSPPSAWSHMTRHQARACSQC